METEKITLGKLEVTFNLLKLIDCSEYVPVADVAEEMDCKKTDLMQFILKHSFIKTSARSGYKSFRGNLLCIDSVKEKIVAPPEDVEIGDMAITYSGDEGSVVAIVPAKKWKTILKYDQSGWIYDKKSLIEAGVDFSCDFLVAIKNNNGENNVYTYGFEGAVVEK